MYHQINLWVNISKNIEQKKNISDDVPLTKPLVEYFPKMLNKKMTKSDDVQWNLYQGEYFQKI